MGGSSLVVPVVLWGKDPPTHCISAVLMTPNQRNIITGCNDGQIGVWDITPTWEIYPRSMLFGHTAAISCLALGSKKSKQQYIVSASENGEMCLWDISDGRCIENTKMPLIHTNMQGYHFRATKDVRLVCNGFYPEIVVIDPMTFEKIYSLCSRNTPDWISACCVLRPVKREEMVLNESQEGDKVETCNEDDVVVAISNSGEVKIWSLTGNETKSNEIYEDESKQIKCLNAQTLTCCQYNQRTVLIVCSKYWQVYSFDVNRFVERRIYDAGDFTTLCSESNRCGERWSGGDFIATDRVIVWSNEGKGYLYKLPTNLLKGKAVGSATPEAPDYHRQSHHPSSPHAYYVLDMYLEKALACSPAMSFHQGFGEKPTKLLFRGDSEGRLVVWTLPQVSERQMTLVRQESFDRLPALSPKCSTTLQEIWKNLYHPPSGLIDGLCDMKDQPLKITSTIYIPSQGKVACGRQDGSIVIAPATQSIVLQLLTNKLIKSEDVKVNILEGHEGKVTCLLYPFSESTRYEPNHLLSGGADFSVIMWDMFSGIRIHTFTVHGGEITQLLVPPHQCNSRILSSVCSVASDHSVTLLSLKERKCIMLAARHLFPVQTIRWRPLDDFMVVSCSDGTVYVWQMETGHLDRVVHGVTAEEILNNCDENALPVDTLVNPHLTFAQALKRRNFATFRNLAHQKLQQPNTPQPTFPGARADPIKPQSYPMYIQGIRTNAIDPDAHIVFFDTESLIVQLLTDEYSTMSPGELEAKGFLFTLPDQNPSLGDFSDAHAKIAGMVAKIKEKAEGVSQKLQGRPESPVPPGNQGTSSPTPNRSSRTSTMVPKEFEMNLTREIAQLFMSLLHAWDLDQDLDKLCLNKLGLLRPNCPISFGMISRMGHMSLMLPGWHKKVCKETVGSASPRCGQVTKQPGMTLKQQARSASFNQPEKLRDPKRHDTAPADIFHDSDSDSEGARVEMLKRETTKPGSSPKAEELKIFSSRARWQISSAVTTQHLLSVISTANTLMSMSHATFLQKKILKKPKKTSSFNMKANLLVETVPSDGSDVGSDTETTETSIMEQSQIKQGWSLLAALHCVLLPEMVGATSIQPPQLEMLARRWQDRCLEIREAAQALLLAELRRIGTEGRQKVIVEWSPWLPAFVESKMSILPQEGNRDEEEDGMEYEDPMLTDDLECHKESSTFESRQRQATAIVMMGVIGAEFGHEMEPSRRGAEDPKKPRPGATQDGFSKSNYSLTKHTSSALMFLLKAPPSRRLPPYTSIRRAAMDLIGRGFTVWEPHLDVSAVLLGLLEMCVDADRMVPSMTYGLPLNPPADACRTARHALSLIATAKAPTFIITIAKEVTRYNTLTQTAQHQHTNINNSVLVRSKHEILRVMELLVEKMPNDIIDHLVSTMDIIMHCIDQSYLKAKGLSEVFPAISRFPMVAVCPVTKRIWVGSKTGALAFYDLKPHSKVQSTMAHAGQIVGVAVSRDGKYLASYSHMDGRLKFWQTASSSLFGIGSQQTKLIKTVATPTYSTTTTNVIKMARFVWTDPRSLIMITPDGQEHKFSV